MWDPLASLARFSVHWLEFEIRFVFSGSEFAGLSQDKKDREMGLVCPQTLILMAINAFPLSCSWDLNRHNSLQNESWRL
jgi:hypothetical protein